MDLRYLKLSLEYDQYKYDQKVICIAHMRINLKRKKVEGKMSSTGKEFMLTRSRGRRKRCEAWTVASLALMWVSGERNRRAFEGVEMNFVNLSNLLSPYLF